MINHSDIAFLELHELAGEIRKGALTSVEVTTAMLDRIEHFADLHAFARVTPEEALEAAARADAALAAGGPTGRLHGVPIAVKDLMHTAGVVAAGGMSIHADFVPAKDATVVRGLREAGAVLLGKLTMTEGAFTQHHPSIPAPRNPWNEQTWAGCSSSGSGVALAAGLCFGATGSDTGGSIRFPASQTGITGLKPTYGRVSKFGAYSMGASLDHIGPMARSAKDCAYLLEAMAGPDPADPTTALAAVPAYSQMLDLTAPPRIGIDYVTYALFDAITRKIIDETVACFVRLGWEIIEVEIPDLVAAAEAYGPLLAVETATSHRETFPARASEYGPELRGLLEQGRAVDVIEYQTCVEERLRFTGLLRRVLSKVDGLLLPAIGVAAPSISTIRRATEDPAIFTAMTLPTAPFDMSGSPTLTLPAGFTAEGSPVGVQLVGGDFDELELLRLGVAFQRATDFHRRRPILAEAATS
ncbi:amidase [Arthrobacter sp. NPDC080031]|uniref:amidase n=1 Tax=Arthrobacter sp. NPDC080031 TaxID=3155918 RepID=UPI00344D1D9B